MQSIGDFQSVTASNYGMKMTASPEVKTQSDMSVGNGTMPISETEQASNGDKEKIKEPALDLAIEKVNLKLASLDKRIERSVHAGTKAIIYKVKDTTTNQILSEFPSENVQTIISKLWEVNGLFVDHKL